MATDPPRSDVARPRADESAVGFGRRDFLRKGAVVGGMVWATPLIQSIGSPAFALSPQPGGRAISNVAFVLVSDESPAKSFRYKFDADAGCAPDPDGPSDHAQPCVREHADLKTQWDAADDGHGDGVPDPAVTGVDDPLELVTVRCGQACWTIDPVDGYAVAWATVMAGGECYRYDGLVSETNTPLYGTALEVCNTDQPEQEVPDEQPSEEDVEKLEQQSEEDVEKLEEPSGEDVESAEKVEAEQELITDENALQDEPSGEAGTGTSSESLIDAEASTGPDATTEPTG